MSDPVLTAPGREAVSAPLRFAPGCPVFPTEGVLHVLTRRGSFELRAKGIDRLHERMHPFLQGTHSEAELLAAAGPAMAGTLGGYLGRLREVGALAGGDAGAQAIHAAAAGLGAARPSLSLRAGRLRVRVSLDGPLPSRRGALTLCFPTPAEAARLLVDLRRSGELRGRMTCVVMEKPPGPPSRAELERRAVWARWLLRNELDVLPDRPRVRIFALGPGGGLERRAVVEAGELSTLARQLGMVRAAAADQVPLVVAEASHPFFAPAACGCGVDFPGVEAYLLRVFLARVLLEGDEGEARAFRAGPIGAAPTAHTTIRVPAGVAAGAAVAPSLATLHLALLEAWADSRVPSPATLPWREVDLLADDAGSHPTVEHLRGVLRLRMQSFPARLAVTRQGLTVCEAGARRARSFLPMKAVSEVLLAAVWDEFHAAGWGAEAPLVVCEAATFATGSEVRRIVRERVAAAGRPVQAAVRRLGCWGTSFWAGVLYEDAP